MKALTVRQPWAGLIALGLKDVENRSWSPGELHVGTRLAIHAGRFDDLERWDALPDDVDIVNALCQKHGVLIATVRLADVVTDSPSRWAVPGHFHWVLDEPKLLRRPRLLRGQPGLWSIPPNRP
jgi:hypothetical protein